jgi:hypothetical protein
MPEELLTVWAELRSRRPPYLCRLGLHEMTDWVPVTASHSAASFIERCARCGEMAAKVTTFTV